MCIYCYGEDQPPKMLLYCMALKYKGDNSNAVVRLLFWKFHTAHKFVFWERRMLSCI